MATTIPPRRPLGVPRDRCGALALRRDRVRLRTVMSDGQTVGRIVDVIFDGRVRRVAGFAVACADGERFLPLAGVAALGPSGIEIESPLHLVDEIDFYRRDGVGLSTVLGRTVAGGRVEDVIARLDTGDIEALVLDSGARVAP